MAAFTPNKSYIEPTVGADDDQWGTLLNSTITIIDTNMGGVLTKSVAGNANVTATASDAQKLVQKLTGVLTGSISYLLPATGGFYIIDNTTTGAFTVTVKTSAGGSTGIVAPQGWKTAVYSDGTDVKLFNSALSLAGGTVDGAVTISTGDLAVTLGNVTLGAGTLILPNNVAITQKDKGGTNRTLLGVNSSNNTSIWNAGGGSFNLLSQASSTLLSVSDAGVAALTGSLTISTDGTSGRLVPNFSQFAPTLGATGANANPGGYLEKWGTVTTAAGGTATITFVAAFPTSCDNVQLTVDGQGFAVSLSGTPSASGFSIISFDVLTTNGAAKDVFWWAIGH